MLRCQFLCHVLKALFFIKKALKLSYFCKKMQNFRALKALHPDPQNSPSIANFWLRACLFQRIAYEPGILRLQQRTLSSFFGFYLQSFVNLSHYNV